MCRKFVAYCLFIEAHRAHADLKQRHAFINQPFHHAGMAPDAAFVVFAQIRVCIELHYTDAFAGASVGDTHHRAIADGVFAAQHERQVALGGNVAHPFADAQQDVARFAAAVNGWVGIDASTARLAAQLVIGFELVGGFDDGRRTLARAAAVADGFFVRYGDDMKARLARRGLADFGAEEDAGTHRGRLLVKVNRCPLRCGGRLLAQFVSM